MIRVNSILFATDFSPMSHYAYKFACGLAKDNNALLEIVHVVMPPVAYGEFGVPAMMEDSASADETLHQMKPPGVRVNHFLLTGDPATEIIGLAKEHQSDLIVMGTHGRTGLGRLLMGSVAEQVVRKAHCPVLTIKVPTVALEKHGLVPEAAAGR